MLRRCAFSAWHFFMVLILILQQKNDNLDLPFYFTLSFFCCFRNANSLLGKRSTTGCFCLIKPKKPRIFGIFPKRKHCTIVSFVQCGYGNARHKWYNAHPPSKRSAFCTPHPSNFLHQLRPIFQNKHDFSISMHHCFFYSSQPQLCIKFRQHPILSVQCSLKALNLKSVFSAFPVPAIDALNLYSLWAVPALPDSFPESLSAFAAIPERLPEIAYEHKLLFPCGLRVKFVI